MSATIEDWLREILRCPQCHGTLADAPERLVCTECGLRYPIIDGIPVLLTSDAEQPQAGDGAERG